MNLKAYLYVWILGGFTAAPLLVLACAWTIWRLSPLVDLERRPEAKERSKAKAQEAALAQTSIVKSGWLTVRRTFEPLPETYAGYIASGYKTFMTKDPRRNRPKDQFFAILKRTSSSAVLFLYDGDPGVQATSVGVDCWAAIDVSLHKAGLYPDERDTPEAELYMKKTAVVLWPKQKAAKEDLKQDGQSEEPAAQGVTDSMEVSREIPWFFVPKTNSEKEDWFHALLDATRLGDESIAKKVSHGAEADLYSPADMAALISNLDAQEDQIPTRWLNAILGRIFLGVYKTQAVEDWITNRILRKLSKVQRPNFLSEIKVAEVDVGNSTPLFSMPMLKELSPDGSASMEMQVRYQGNISVKIATVARVTLHKIKPVESGLVLKVTLKELSGRVLFKIKPHPSNRVWMGFTSQPHMEIDVEPIVASRQIKWGPLVRLVQSKIRELVAESIVDPNLDDTPFFDSARSQQRGGIFADTKREKIDVDALLKELLASLIAARATSEGQDTGAAASEPEKTRESQQQKKTCSACGQCLPKSAPSPPSEKPSTEAAETESKAPESAQVVPQHVKRNSWSWAGSKQFFTGSTASLASSTSSSTAGPSAETGTPSRPKRHTFLTPSSPTNTFSSDTSSSIRGLPPPYEPLQEVDELNLDSKEHSAMGQLRGVLQRDGLHRPESAPAAAADMSRRSSTSSHTSEHSRPSRPSSMTSQPVQPVASSSSSTRSTPASISSQHSEADADVSTPMAEPDNQLREGPRSRAASLTVPKLAPSSTSSPESRSSFLPPPKRLVPLEPKPSEGGVFDTLKARANEKGVNIDQARNAMRRWGANWAGKKQEHQHDESSESDTQVNDDGTADQRPRSASQPRPTVSGNGVSLASGQATTSLSTSLGASSSEHLSPSASSSSLHSSTSQPPERAASSGVYKAAPTMSIPSILSPANRGGIGSDGPTHIVPQRPGDKPEPAPESRTSFLPPSLKKWREGQTRDVPAAATGTIADPALASSSTAEATAAPALRKVPPPFFPKPTATPESTDAASSSKVQDPPEVETHAAREDGKNQTEEQKPGSQESPAVDADEAGWQFDD